MSLAWHTAAFGRMEKMPALADVIGPTPKIKKQTPAEMRGVFAAMREAAI